MEHRARDELRPRDLRAECPGLRSRPSALFGHSATTSARRPLQPDPGVQRSRVARLAGPARPHRRSSGAHRVFGGHHRRLRATPAGAVVGARDHGDVLDRSGCRRGRPVRLPRNGLRRAAARGVVRRVAASSLAARRRDVRAPAGGQGGPRAHRHGCCLLLARHGPLTRVAQGDTARGPGGRGHRRRHACHRREQPGRGGNEYLGMFGVGEKRVVAGQVTGSASMPAASCRSRPTP